MFPEAKILKVDLTTRSISTDMLSADLYRQYPGGSALALYYLLKEMKPGVDALSEDNVLVFSVSPLTGLPISGQSRMVISAKSPLTGGIGDSQSGGYFAKELKCNGWDAIVFKGQAPSPVYLFIDGEDVELRSAEKIWGKITGEAEDTIKAEIGKDDVEVAQIGPAGENLVRFACVLNMCNRANGRTGMGAVMGSKKLKAVVVKKKRARKAADPELLGTLTRDFKERLEAAEVVNLFHIHGTACDLLVSHEDGFLPSRNYSTGHFPEAAINLDGETMTKTILKSRDTCFGCAVRCKRVVHIPGKADPRYGGPEYETVMTMGAYCGISSLENTAVSNQLCNMYGLDTISCGATIAFAMDCYENNLIDKNDTGGIELTFGNEEAVNTLIPLIAARQGFGDVLAEGSRLAAKKIGKKAERFVMAVKGNEIPAHMPQYKPALGILYSVNSFGADHESCEHDPSLTMPEDSMDMVRLGQLGLWKRYDDSFTLDDEKVRFALLTQQFYAACDTLCLCLFCWGPAWQLYGPQELVTLCKAGIGWKTSVYELMKIGERRLNLLRVFNAREGFTKKDDQLPDRLYQPLPDGPAKGKSINRADLERAKELYYQMAGWSSESGNPTRRKLKELSLGWLEEYV
jgi:aldehyde:ferredoxin oxidoreductase